MIQTAFHTLEILLEMCGMFWCEHLWENVLAGTHKEYLNGSRKEFELPRYLP